MTTAQTIHVVCPHCNKHQEVDFINRYSQMRKCCYCHNTFFVGAMYFASKEMSQLELAMNKIQALMIEANRTK
jgi:hypothetical protein